MIRDDGEARQRVLLTAGPWPHGIPGPHGISRLLEVTDDWPFALIYTVFFLGALARGSATYLAGRALRSGGQRTRLSRHLDRESVRRAERVVGRWGAPAVTLSFLTVGFQTAVNAAAGALRMPWRRYLPGVVCGALIWAWVYTTIGFVVLGAVFGRTPWPWVVGAVVAVVLVVVATALVRRRRTPALVDATPKPVPSLDTGDTGEPPSR